MAPENPTVLFSRTVLMVPSGSNFKSAQISERPKVEVFRVAPTITLFPLASTESLHTVVAALRVINSQTIPFFSNTLQPPRPQRDPHAAEIEARILRVPNNRIALCVII